MAGAGRTTLLAAVTAAILIATLWPAPAYSPGVDQEPISVRELADAVANILLFAPFGIAAALRFRGWQLPIATGVALSVLIELMQLLVPGRYPTPSDIIFNTLGTAFGAGLVWRFNMWARPQSWLRWLLPIGAVLATLAVTAATPFLFAMAIPPHVLYGQWTAEFNDMAHYEGRVAAAFVGGMPVPSRRIATSNTLRHRLLGGETVRVEFFAGPAPPRLAPIFSIYDDRAHEMLLIGADGNDVVVRFRTRARAVRLDERELRVEDALAGIEAGQASSLRFQRKGRGYCLSVGAKSWCDLGFTIGDTWGLLLYPIPRPIAVVLPYIWLAALAFPAGFWVRSDPALAATGLVLALTLALVPHWAGILPTPVYQFVAALAGAGSGSLAGRSVDRAGRPRAASAVSHG